jgi:hypothetical protein
MPSDLRSFRYEVEMDCAGAAGPLVDPPIFESVWIAFRRRSRAPAWEAWTSR